MKMRSSKQSGFTLIEILVVLLMVTIISGIVVTRLPAFAVSADLDRETRRLELLLNMAHSEALLDSAELGFRLTDEGYTFLKFDDEGKSYCTIYPIRPLNCRKYPRTESEHITTDTCGFTFD